MSLRQLPKEELDEMSFIELAEQILEEKKQTISFQDIVKEIGNLLELSQDELRRKMIQFYTELNIDGRFIGLGDNNWGLRAWYPIDQIDEEVTHTAKTKKRKAKVIDKDDDEEDSFEEDLDFDDLDEIVDDDDDDFVEEDEDENDEDLIDDDELVGSDEFDDIDDDDDDELLSEDHYDIDEEDEEDGDNKNKE